MTLLFPSAQKEVNSKLLLVFLVLLRPSPCSLMWLLRVVLEYYFVWVPLEMTKIWTYSKRPLDDQKLSRW